SITRTQSITRTLRATLDSSQNPKFCNLTFEGTRRHVEDSRKTRNSHGSLFRDQGAPAREHVWPPKLHLESGYVVGRSRCGADAAVRSLQRGTRGFDVGPAGYRSERL